MSLTIRTAAKAVAAFAVAALAFLSCSKPDDKKGKGEFAISLKGSALVDCRKSSQFLRIQAPSTCEWTLSLEFDDETAESWATLSRNKGTGSTSSIFITWSANSSRESRSVRIVLSGDGKEKDVVMTQNGTGSDVGPVTELDPDPVPDWMELPQTQDGDGCYFFTHGMSIPQGNFRNYSFYLDAAAKISVWVAYPLNDKLIGPTSGRSEAWDIDPKVPMAYQSVLWSRSYPGSYDRGHQLPSADRQYLEPNEETYYGTNMTPQLASLNQKDWGVLENKVRSWSRQFDTLYVVTGADIRGGYSTTTDNVGKAIAIPNGYFKALLGYKRSGTIANTGSTGGFAGIAFYYEHKGSNTGNVMSHSMSISSLETKTGMNFFVNLPAKAGGDNASRAESTVDSWWSKN